MVRKPAGLKKGDKIGIVAPASPMIRKRLERGVRYLERRGYPVVLGQHIFDQQGYLAGPDETRANDLLAMFRDPEIKAVICARGGYGIHRILDLLHYDLLMQHPKILVGYSDLTALQLAIWQRTRLVTYSGPMAAVEMGLGIHPFTESIFWRTLEAGGFEGSFPMPPGHQVRILRAGRAKGRLLGGCLSLISHLLGTPFEPDFTGAILFLEDIGEDPYRVDRYLAQMRLIHVFDRISAVVLGQFIDCVPSGTETPSLSIDEVLEDYFGRLNVPVLANFPYGHGDVKVTMPIGLAAELDTERGELRLLEPSVEAPEAE